MARAPLRTVGVLGGMGPEATVHFMQRVIERVDAGDDIDHVPMLVDNNTQVPSRIKALLEGGGEDPAPVLARMARRLEAAGAQALVMPCNTAHNYAAQVQAAVSIPFISMVERSCDLLAACYPQAVVGILASPAVIRTHVYDAPLRRRGLQPLIPQDEDNLLRAIRALKRSARDGEAINMLDDAASDVLARGAAVALVGCSEFSIVADKLRTALSLIDSVDILANATVAFSRHEDSLP